MKIKYTIVGSSGFGFALGLLIALSIEEGVTKTVVIALSALIATYFAIHRKKTKDLKSDSTIVTAQFVGLGVFGFSLGISLLLGIYFRTNNTLNRLNIRDYDSINDRFSNEDIKLIFLYEKYGLIPKDRFEVDELKKKASSTISYNSIKNGRLCEYFPENPTGLYDFLVTENLFPELTKYIDSEFNSDKVYEDKKQQVYDLLCK